MVQVRVQPPLIYSMSARERFITGSLAQMFDHHGCSSQRLPRILISFEPPPLWVTFPDQDPMLRQAAVCDDVPRRPPDFESLLGQYDSSTRSITLFDRGLESLAGRFKSKNRLRTVVLTHELAHWAIHVFHGSTIQRWREGDYEAMDGAAHELLAQLFAWHALENFLDVRCDIETLASMQSPIYSGFLRHTQASSPSSLVSIIGALRASALPIRMADLLEELA